MGHVIRWAECKNSEKELKKMWADVNTAVQVETVQEGGSGIYPYEFLTDKVFDSYEEAVEHINAHDKDYATLCVRYKNHSYNFEESQKLKDLRQKLQKLSEKKIPYYVTTVTSKFVTCKHCGSKLNREILVNQNRDYCSVCCESLRPEYYEKKIHNRYEKIRKLKKDIANQYQKELKKQKYDIRILMKYEYHI